MKEKIHPKYVEAVITCACGFSYKTMSTKPKIAVEICSHCHPVYTGKKKRTTVITGRIEKFERKYGKIK